jgi:hypothetical protein
MEERQREAQRTPKKIEEHGRRGINICWGRKTE